MTRWMLPALVPYQGPARCPAGGVYHLRVACGCAKDLLIEAAS